MSFNNKVFTPLENLHLKTETHRWEFQRIYIAILPGLTVEDQTSTRMQNSRVWRGECVTEVSADAETTVFPTISHCFVNSVMEYCSLLPQRC